MASSIEELEREVAELRAAAEAPNVRSRVMAREQLMAEMLEELRERIAKLDRLPRSTNGACEPIGASTIAREIARAMVLDTARRLAALD